jgi:SAM-dependent methyltransferase
MTSDALAYHRAELAIALSSDDARRLVPSLPAAFDTILDVGCGAGQTLIACGLPSTVHAWGVDVDDSALALGRMLTSDVHFVCAPGEQLPFADESFDVVVSRVALPYMHLPRALEEISRVLKPGGHFWTALHPTSMLANRIRASLWHGRVKDLLYSTYVAVNSVLFHVSGRQVRFPLNRRRCESVQTVDGMRRALWAAGLEPENIRTDPFFVVTARKPASRSEEECR